MNKNAIKKFAIEARKKLIASVSDRAGMLGITPEGCSEPISKGTDFEVYKTVAGTEVTLGRAQCEQRRKLKEQIEARGFEAVVEEVAYTWFNRICAIRFMEVNDYLPTRVRVLSSEKEGKNEPDIVTQAPDVDLDFADKEREYILECKMNNKLDELFKMLFIKQCNKLSEILPELFEATEDYTEMLLNISYTNKDDVISMLVNPDTGIPEADFNVSTIGEDGQPTGQVEIIGWLYQYYNTELKDDTFAQLKKNVKISKERIPAATQLFTPDWIVRYMVENSVGRIWIEHLRAVDSSVNEKEVAERFGWKYYLPEAEQEADVNVKLAEIRISYKDLKPEDITCIDPCMGSGHILVAMFDVLMDIYKSAGYSERDAAFEIVEHNIHGLDIDKRAYQLAYFAIMMKGRQYNRRFFNGKVNNEGDRKQVETKVFVIGESNLINRQHLNYFGTDISVSDRNEVLNEMNLFLNEFLDASSYGSVVHINKYNWEILKKFIATNPTNEQIDIFTLGLENTRKKLNSLINIGMVLSQCYDVVVTNPPYMGISNANAKLVKFAKKEFPDSYSDLSTMFMEKTMHMCRKHGFMAMINIPSWMFIGSYENMRKTFLEKYCVCNMLHFARGVFGSDFGTTGFVYRASKIKNYYAKYKALFRTQGTIDSVEEKEKMFFDDNNLFIKNQEKFEKIPGYTMAYWISDNELDIFSNSKLLETISPPRTGMMTTDNNRFLRYWHEVNITNIGLNIPSIEKSILSEKKWFPYNKGGDFRRWYGNRIYVVNWKNGGEDIYNAGMTSFRGKDYYFKEGITWSIFGFNNFAARYTPIGAIFDIGGTSTFPSGDIQKYILALLNSKIAFEYISIVNPTVNIQNGDIKRIPFILSSELKDKIDNLCSACVEESKADWDSYENSWEFKKHPLVQYASFTPQEITADKARHISDMGLIRDAYELWNDKCKSRFNQLKANEEELNRIFIEIYGLQDELTPDVEDKDITVRKADLQRDIKSLLSYAVGCMFGRYSLDCEGIAYAGGEWDDSKYVTFIPNKDNCIPITDDEYTEDDIVGRLCEWLKKVYGTDTLEENLDFIANALGNKGQTSRETIREYFVNDFMADHMKIYQKRPIYWLFDSGKANGFKALVYMHRYNADTVAKVRIDYLHNIQKSIEQAKLSAEYLRDNGSGAEKAKATKFITKYTKQLAEIHLYDEAMAHIANQRIDIDLDDGVKINYEKFQGVEVAQEGKKALKVDLLAKIK